MKVNSTIYSIIAKSFTSSLSDKESSTLADWLGQSEENRKEYNDYRILWEKTKSFSNPLLFDNVQIALNETKRKVLIRNNFKQRLRTFYKVAASLAILFTIGVVTKKYIHIETYSSHFMAANYQELKTPLGTQSKFTLPDGTLVYLNSGSSLRFPVDFSNQKTREIYLSGEAYFEVVSDKSKPFLVNTDILQIKVLGTSFNVNAYRDDPTISVALLEGAVTINEKIHGTIHPLIGLKPNQIAEYSKVSNNIVKRDESNLDKYACWKDGKVVFYNELISLVVQKLERYYNVDIEIVDPIIYKYRFTGTFLNESLENILNVLSLTSNMQYTSSSVNMAVEGSKRKIVLKAK